MKMELALEQTKRAIISCLTEIPFLKFKQVKALPKQETFEKPDLIIQCQDGLDKKILIIESKQSGQPRLAREAINQLFVYLKNRPDGYAIFSAPYISPEAANLCLQNGIGYLDFAGNCFLNFGRIFIKKEGNSNPFTEKRDLRSLYFPKAERALRVLLSEPKRVWGIQELANTAEISIGQAHNVKKLLLDREWVRVSSGGFYLEAPEALLCEWSKNYNFRRNISYDFYSLRSLGEIEEALSSFCRKEKITYALTGFSGCARVASSVRYQRVMAYIKNENIKSISHELGLKEVTNGANVTLLEPYDTGVFYNQKSYDQDQTVSPIQLYLDLMTFRGRGEEAATVLFDEVIQKSW